MDGLCLCLMIESLTSNAVYETLFYALGMILRGMDMYGSFLANDVGQDRCADLKG